MVLRTDRQGAGIARTLQQQRGAAAVEFALALPFVVLTLIVLTHAAVLGADLVAAQTVAAQAARLAAVEDDRVVVEAVRTAAGRRPVEVTITPPSPARSHGDVVAATVRLRSKAFAPLGTEVWLPATASSRVERP